MVELRQLRYFVAVARHRHFTRAAEELFLAQPALSQQVRKLERELGVQLFDRGHHSVTLTAAGAALLVFFPGVTIYLCAALLLGFGNAGVRVARSAALLHLVDKKVMGRVGSFFHACDRVLRTALTSAVIAIVAAGGARPAFALLLVLVLAGLVAVWQSRSALQPAATA